MDNFTRPNSSIGATHALELAQKYKHNNNYPYMRELLDIVMLDDKNTEPLIEWFKNIGLYKDEIIANVVSKNDIMLALSFARLSQKYVEQLLSVMLNNFTPVFAVVWYKNVEYEGNYLLKLRAIELGEAQSFVQFMNGGNDKYTLEDFYSDLPNESQIGIVI